MHAVIKNHRVYEPDQMGIVFDGGWPSKCGILCVHILMILVHVKPHQSHGSKQGKKEIQSTVVPVLAFYKNFKLNKLFQKH